MLSDICKIKSSDINELLSLFINCFYDDYYYSKIFPDISSRNKQMKEKFLAPISFCVNYGEAYKITDDVEMIAFILLFDYDKTKNINNKMFNIIFKGEDNNSSLPYKKEIHNRIDLINKKVFYLLSICVHKDYRRLGIASKFIDFILKMHKNDSVVSDISNIESLSIYTSRNFIVKNIDNNYSLVIYPPF